MTKILYDVEVRATVRQWYTVEASSEEEARELALNGDGDWPVSEEVLDAEVVHVAEEFDQDLDLLLDKDEHEDPDFIGVEWDDDFDRFGA